MFLVCVIWYTAPAPLKSTALKRLWFKVWRIAPRKAAAAMCGNERDLPAMPIRGRSR
jgi:hypothetical protein